MSMDASACLLLTLSFLSPSAGDSAYTGEELRVLQTLGHSLGVKSFIFVRDHDPVGMLEELRYFRKHNAFCGVINSCRLDDILKDVARKVLYFGDRLVLVTKEHLNFTDAIEKITSEAITVYKAYNLKPGLDMALEILSKGNGSDSLALRKGRVNFQKVVLDVLRYSTEEDCKQSSVNYVLNRMECFHQEILGLTAGRLNFSINKVDCLERRYPYNYPNGSLSDLFLMLARKEADISAGSYIISESRLNSYDFIWPVFTTSSMMYIKFRSSEVDWQTYVRPVSGDVWKAIISWITLTGVLIHFFDESRSGNFKLGLSLFPKLIKSVLATLQVFCNQGVHNISQWYSDRTVFMLTYLLFVSLYQAYTGCLISSLTVVTPDIPFKDINEFFRDGTYKIMTVEKGFHNFFVKEAIRQLKMESRGLMVDDKLLPPHSKKGIAQLCDSKRLVYVEFRENIVQHHIPCKITELPKSMLHRNVGIGFPKHSPYREIMNRELTLLRSAGILHRMRKHLLSYKKLEEKEISKEEYVNVTVGHVFSIFFALGVGVVVAVVVFFFELLCFHSMKVSFYDRPNCKKK